MSVVARTSRCLGPILAGAFSLWAPLAAGFSLGSPEVLSHLGEPLHLRVVLSQDSPALPVRARLPDESGYLALGLPVPEHTISDLNLSVSQRSATESVIHLRSDAAVRTPVLSLLLQLEIGGEIWIRQLDLLLDPRPTSPPPSPRPPAREPLLPFAAEPPPSFRPDSQQDVVPGLAPQAFILEPRLRSPAPALPSPEAPTPLPAYRFDWELGRAPAALGPDSGKQQAANPEEWPPASAAPTDPTGEANAPTQALNDVTAGLPARTPTPNRDWMQPSVPAAPIPPLDREGSAKWPWILLIVGLLIVLPLALRSAEGRYARWLAARIRGLVPWPAESSAHRSREAPYPIDWSSGISSSLGREIEQEIERQGASLDRRLLVVQALIERGREKDARRVLKQIRAEDKSRSAERNLSPPTQPPPSARTLAPEQATPIETSSGPALDREQLDQRLASMRKGYLSIEVSRQLQVVEAFLNRGRLEQARRLLDALSAPD